MPAPGATTDAVPATVPENLLLLDTPDIDSDAPVNWRRADTIRRTADVLIAVLTEQKYNDAAVKQFFRMAVEADKPVGVICHGPWTLVEADVVRGRTLTSYPSVRTDIRNAGGNVVDREVVIDGTLVSSRNPDDLPAFCEAIVDVFSSAASRV